MQFSTLFIISLFSAAIALTGCMGSDNYTSPVKPNNPSTPNDNETGGDNTDDGSNNGGNNGGNQIPTIPGLPTPPNDNDGNNNTPEDLTCEAPNTSITNTTFGDVGDLSKYDIDKYDEVSSTDNLEGTWVVIGGVNTNGYNLNNPSILVKQKHFLVIKAVTPDAYQVANCSGIVNKKDILGEENCFDSSGKEIECKEDNPPIVIGSEYMPWNGYLEQTITENEITLPVSLAATLDFEITSNSYLKNLHSGYEAKKISNNIDALGSLSLTNTRQNITTEKVYYKELTADELMVYKSRNVHKDIEKLSMENISSYNFIDLSSKTVTFPEYSSEFIDKNLTCLSQLVLYTRQCTSKDSEKSTETDSLAAFSATSTESYHQVFGAKKDTTQNSLTVYNLTVKDGKSTEIESVGTQITEYSDIDFDQESTINAENMNLNFEAETLNKDTHSHKTGFKALCTLTEGDYLSDSGGDCDNKKIYKTLHVKTSTIKSLTADIELSPEQIIN